MKEIEDKILEVINELESWKKRENKVKLRLEKGEADISELDRINEQISHYLSLLHDMKKKMSSTDVSRTIFRSGNP
jgi:hypothetical protein|tara:strand:- start:12861 stop:13088 length:228 start_codon:yes stop_codon:yes gene_type:complete